MVGLEAETVIFIVFPILTLIAVILLFLFLFAVIIDCLKRSFKTDTEKILWVLLIIITPIFGALLYYFIIQKKDKRVLKFSKKILKSSRSLANKVSKKKN